MSMDKATLREYRNIAAEAEELDRQIALLRDKALSCQWVGGQLQGSFVGDRTGDIGAEVADICSLLEVKQTDLLHRLVEIERAIDCLDTIERRVIRLYYIHGLRWEEIALKIPYSVQHVWKIHGDALKKMRDFKR